MSSASPASATAAGAAVAEPEGRCKQCCGQHEWAACASCGDKCDQVCECGAKLSGAKFCGECGATVAIAGGGYDWWHARPKGGPQEVKGMVFCVAGSDDDDRTLGFGQFKPDGDLTAGGHRSNT